MSIIYFIMKQMTNLLKVQKNYTKLLLINSFYILNHIYIIKLIIDNNLNNLKYVEILNVDYY